MLRIVLYYGWPIQEKETSAIREGKRSAEGTQSLLPGSGERCLGDSVKGPQFLLSFLAACGDEERYRDVSIGDILKDQLQELQETFYREIPITKQLGITVENYDGEQLTLKA